MKEWISEAELRRFYWLLSARMTDFDCGTLCAPANHGIPCCCDQKLTLPILYANEYRWQRRKSGFWRRTRPLDPEEEKVIGDLDAFYVAAKCAGLARCRRSRRALVCRMFPFEPHLDDKGGVLGITYQYEAADRCPLVGRRASAYNPAYIRNSVMFWQEILCLLPREREMYRRESRKLRRRFKRAGKRVQVFRQA